MLSNIVARDSEALNLLRQEFDREYCAARFVSNLWNRDALIMRNLSLNLEDQTRGRDVGDSIAEWRKLNTAIESVLNRYWNDLTEGHRQSLASLVISILSRIFQTNTDLYIGRTRAPFVGESGDGNLFRRFLAPRAEPIAFVSTLQRLDANLLASRTDSLRDLINVFNSHGEAYSESEQYRLVYQALVGIWSRESILCRLARNEGSFTNTLQALLLVSNPEHTLVDVPFRMRQLLESFIT